MAMAPNKKTMAGKSIQLHFDEDQMVKPAISLELSLSPSNEADELAAALSRDESDDVPSMETACELVQTLLDQVAWNDAPPTNEVISKKPMIKESKTTQEYSRQCHVQPKSPNMMALQNTATGSDDPSDLWKTHYNLRCTPSEQQMGNVALAALCARTLETVGKPSRPTKEAKSGGPKESPHPGRKAEGSAPWRRKNSPKRQWLRKKNKKRSPSANSPKQGSNSKEEGAFFGEDNEREDRDDHFTNPSTLDPENREPNRLQMFGSEYARYLSTTALAPKDLTSRGLSTNTRTLKNYRRRNLKKVQCLEEAEQSVLTGAITDLIVTHGDEIPPKGYYRLSQSADGEHFFLRDRKAPVYINVKKETNWDRAAQRPCVTALALIFPERKEFVPPGFSVVRKYNSLPKLNERGPANLNFGGEAVFLCFRRSREGNPITGIIPLHPVKRESIPEGYTVLERTPRNFVASIQTAASQVFLAYRQRLANLELLRPLPLVMSVRSGSKSRRLTAYYCTGGTVVDSRVGRFHIMDRSTHSLLSPSSVSNRLSLIETSRRKTLNSIGENSSSVGSTYSYSAGNSGCPRSSNEVLTSSLLMAHGLGTKGSRSDVSDLEKISIQGDFDSIASSSVVENDASKSVNQSCISLSFTNDDDSFDVTGQPMSPRPNHCIDTSQDKELQRCLEALSFIPVVSTGLDENDPKGMLRFKARVLIIIPVLVSNEANFKYSLF